MLIPTRTLNTMINNMINMQMRGAYAYSGPLHSLKTEHWQSISNGSVNSANN